MNVIKVEKEKLPLLIKYGSKEYIIKATPKGLLMIKKEY